MEFVTALFLVVCGIQTSISLIPEIQQSSNSWRLMRKIATSKFDQLVTLMTAFVMLDATLLVKLGSSMFWKGSTSKALINCRKDWRLNLLTIGNYATKDSHCIENSWILSVEFHMIIVGFAVLYALNKFPRAKTMTAILTILSSFALAATTIYVKQLTPVTFISPE